MAVSDPLRSADVGDGIGLARRQLAALHGVRRTAVVSLLARHLATTRPDPIVADPAASLLVAQLGLSALRRDWTFPAVEAVTAIRTLLIDRAASDFARRDPGATIVTVGAGLCTRHVRLAGLPVSWVDVDLPEVMALRRTVLPAGSNRVTIAAAAGASGWRDGIDDRRGTLFILEGLTMYLAEAAVRELVTDLAGRFPGSELLIETVGPRPRPPSRYHYLVEASRPTLQFTWGVRDHRQIASWHRSLQLKQTWFLMDHYPAAWPLPLRVMRKLPGVRNQAKIGRFTVQPPSSSTTSPTPNGPSS